MKNRWITKQGRVISRFQTEEEERCNFYQDANMLAWLVVFCVFISGLIIGGLIGYSFK